MNKLREIELVDKLKNICSLHAKQHLYRLYHNIHIIIDYCFIRNKYSMFIAKSNDCYIKQKLDYLSKTYDELTQTVYIYNTYEYALLEGVKEAYKIIQKENIIYTYLWE